jgi:hypothetical protein
MLKAMENVQNPIWNANLNFCSKALLYRYGRNTWRFWKLKNTMRFRHFCKHYHWKTQYMPFLSFETYTTQMSSTISHTLLQSYSKITQQVICAGIAVISSSMLCFSAFFLGLDMQTLLSRYPIKSNHRQTDQANVPVMEHRRQRK